ncbi:hypothetical protein PR048_025202 [Dryococelus australis]|uniref:Uncharacterized protein n=1 Tax=Dryococelus australis TaxID=614101 RepID=A0ABQ9GQQ0_9NEOP|nr:hypothetical protein PR048_025202 [Dryococelus australis]
MTLVSLLLQEPNWPITEHLDGKGGVAPASTNSQSQNTSKGGGAGEGRRKDQHDVTSVTSDFSPDETISCNSSTSIPSTLFSLSLCSIESCRTMPLVGGFSRGSPVCPALAFTALLLPRITSPSTALEYFDVKSRPFSYIKVGDVRLYSGNTLGKLCGSEDPERACVAYCRTRSWSTPTMTSENLFLYTLPCVNSQQQNQQDDVEILCDLKSRPPVLQQSQLGRGYPGKRLHKSPSTCRFSAFEAKRRWSDKGDTASRIKYVIDTKHKALD